MSNRTAHRKSQPAHPITETPAAETNVFTEASGLLGGVEAPSSRLRTPIDVHEALLRGLPGSALTTLLGGLLVLPQTDKRLERALGISLRTIQRKKATPGTRLTPDQAGRAWKFAEVLARATRVFGSQEAAERWLDRPAIGLDRICPIDLLATPAGTQEVDQYLGRIQYGVYT